jgi:hypothetical protein
MKSKMQIFSFFDFTLKPALFTPWSLAHFITGIAFKSMDVSSRNAFLIHLIYELKDLYISYVKQKNLNPNLPNSTIQNSFLNSIVDQISFEIGFSLIPKIKERETILLFFILAFLIISAPKRGNDNNWNFKIWYNRG